MILIEERTSWARITWELLIHIATGNTRRG